MWESHETRNYTSWTKAEVLCGLPENAVNIFEHIPSKTRAINDWTVQKHVESISRAVIGGISPTLFAWGSEHIYEKPQLPKPMSWFSNTKKERQSLDSEVKSEFLNSEKVIRLCWRGWLYWDAYDLVIGSAVDQGSGGSFVERSNHPHVTIWKTLTAQEMKYMSLFSVNTSQKGCGGSVCLAGWETRRWPRFNFKLFTRI